MVTSVNNSTSTAALTASTGSSSTSSASSSSTSTSSSPVDSNVGSSIIGALGGSQIDIQSLASQLVEAERVPLQSLIDRQRQVLDNKITSIGRIYAVASSMKESLASFGSDPRSSAYLPQSTDTTKASFSFTGVPSDFSMTISVKQLATENKVTLNGFSSTWPTSGKLTITEGQRATSSESPLEFEYADYESIEDLRDAINEQGPYKAEILTTVVDGTKVKYMAITRGTGADRNFFVSTVDSDGEDLTSDLYVTPANSQASGVDAIISSGGQEYKYFKNKFVDLVPGVSINIAETTKTGETITLSTSIDTSKYTAVLREMVSSYNSLQATIADEIRFSADINTRGGLASDPVARGFLYQMRRMTTETITTYNGNNVSLSSVGIRTNADGTLTINEAALAKAQEDPALMEAVLSSTKSGTTTIKGAFQKLSEFSDTIMGRDSALIKEYKEASTTEMQEIEGKVEKLNQQMDALKQRYLKQFIAMQEVLNQTNSASTSLKQNMSAWTSSMQNN
jgi:flagellar hook-associated protein 2